MNYFALFISSVGFSGFYLSWLTKGRLKAGGTIGSLVGLLFLFIFMKAGWSFNHVIGVILASFLAGVLFIPPAEMFMLEKWGERKRHTGELVSHDFNETCIDEVHGVWLAALPIFLKSAPWYFLIGSFVLFRIFDIAKPWPIKRVEKKLPHGTGVMLDDTIAGFYAAILVYIIICLM